MPQAVGASPLHGMAGIGKTVMAAALARDYDVKVAFPDGVFWLQLGPVAEQVSARSEESGLRSFQTQLARAVGDGEAPFDDVEQGRSWLNRLLADRQCLLILDNAWSAEQIHAFEVVGPRGRLLITSRDAGVSAARPTAEHRLDVLSEQQAVSLLENISGDRADTTPELRDVAQECGWVPLALDICGSMAREGTPDRPAFTARCSLERPGARRPPPAPA